MQTQKHSRPGGTIACDDQGAGHSPHAKLPDDTAPTIVAFLHSLAQQTGPAGSESAVAHGN